MIKNFDLGNDWLALTTDLGTDKEEMIVVCSLTKESIVLGPESMKKLREIFNNAKK